MSIGVIMLLVMIIFILFVNMVLSAIAANNAYEKDPKKTKTCSTAAAVAAGLSVAGLVLFLILYIWSSSEEKVSGGGFYGEEKHALKKTAEPREPVDETGVVWDEE